MKFKLKTKNLPVISVLSQRILKVALKKQMFLLPKFTLLVIGKSE